MTESLERQSEEVTWDVDGIVVYGTLTHPSALAYSPPLCLSRAVDRLTETGAHRCCLVPTAVPGSLLTPLRKRDSLRCDMTNAPQARTCVKTSRGLSVR